MRVCTQEVSIRLSSFRKHHGELRRRCWGVSRAHGHSEEGDWSQMVILTYGWDHVTELGTGRGDLPSCYLSRKNTWLLKVCYGLNCVPPKFIDVLTPNITIFGDRDFQEVINIKSGEKGGTLIQCDWCLVRRGRDARNMCTGQRPCKDTARRWLSASLGERPQDNANLLPP